MGVQIVFVELDIFADEIKQIKSTTFGALTSRPTSQGKPFNIVVQFLNQLFNANGEKSNAPAMRGY